MEPAISDNEQHLIWRVPYIPGTLKAKGKKDGKEIMVTDKTAGVPAEILLEPDRDKISADGKDLSFVTVTVLDKEGTMVPFADNMINFKISGEGKIIGVDNGSETSHEPFKADYRKAFNGMCLVVIQSNSRKGKITLDATGEGLKPASVVINTQ